MKPIVGKAPSQGKKPVTGDIPPPRRFIFSFRFFKEQRYFGIGTKESGWFSSVLSKLADISLADYDQLMSDFRAKQIWRLHEINWNAKSMPVLRQNLDWIDKQYIDNSEEFPFFQFQITKAHGRVVGFWDEDGIFNIVFLDPLHNMQPSAYSDYKLIDSAISRSDFSAAIDFIESAIAKCSPECGCKSLYANIQARLAFGLPPHTMLVCMPEAVFKKASHLVTTGLADGIAGLLEIGIDALESSKAANPAA
jgi:hypothetical protein